MNLPSLLAALPSPNPPKIHASLRLDRFGLKLAPSEHQQVFDSVDMLVKGLFKELDVVSLGGTLSYCDFNFSKSGGAPIRIPQL